MMTLDYRGPLTFAFRCDGPSRRRQMRMSVTRLGNGPKPLGFLFHSQMLDAADRPPLNIYDFQAQLDALRHGADLPLVSMCSFCQRVRWQAKGEGSPLRWIEA